MNETDNQELLRRLAQLEEEVTRLRAGEKPSASPPALPPVIPLAASIPPIPLPQRPASSGPPALPPPLPSERWQAPQETPSPAMERFSTLLSLENILSKIGIGLLVLGVIYFLKVSVDRGWFTPTVRVGLGFGLACGLLLGGLRLIQKRVVLAQVFLGGALASFYATFYAAEQLYGIIQPTPAFLLMLAVTVGGYVVSLRHKVPAPMVIALLGGMAAPFILGSHDLAVVPVAVYTLLLIVGSAAVVARLGWMSVWWSGLFGGVFILHALTNHLSAVSPQKEIDQIVLTGSLLLWWGIHAGIPLWRLMRVRDEGTSLRTGILIGAFLVPVLAMGGILEVWEMSKTATGSIALAASLVYFMVSKALSQHVMHQRAHRLSALLLAVAGLLLLLQGDAGFIVVLALGIVLLETYRRTGENVVQGFGHLAFAVAGVWLLVRLFEEAYRPFVIRPDALANLAGVVAFLMVWFRHPQASWRGVYWVFGTVFALGWLAREASLAIEPMAWLTLFWGLYALVLIVASVVKWNAWVRRTGLVLLVVVLTKMIFVDLAAVPTEWRVVLFMGFGGLMLGISYVLPRIAPDWNKMPPDSKPSQTPEGGDGPPPLA
jgi:uncharacterized membrane protein